MQELSFWILFFGLILIFTDWGSTIAFGGKDNWRFVEASPLNRRLGVYGSLIFGVLFISGVSFWIDFIIQFMNSDLGVTVIYWMFVAFYIFWSFYVVKNLIMGYHDR